MTKKLNINFKKLVLAAIAFAFALPLFTSGDTFAEGNCTGPSNYSELSSAIDQVSSTGTATITLCGNITYQRPNPAINVVRGNVTIDLNGFTVTGGTNTAAISVGRERLGGNRYNYGKLTIIGEGTVSGPINVQYTQNGASLTLKGGTYTASNAGTYAASGYEAYSMNGKYTVAEEGLEVYNVNGTDVLDEPGLAVYGEAGSQVLEPEITEDNFAVASSYFKVYTYDNEPDEYNINVRIGSPLENAFSVVLPENSTSGIGIDIDEDGIIEIDENNTITGLSTGYAKVTVYPTYDTSIGFSFFVNVYDVLPSDENEEAEVVAADTIKDLIDNEWPEEPSDISDKLTEAFGEEDAEDMVYDLDEAMYWGDKIYAQIEKNEDAEPTDEEKEKIEAILTAEGVDTENITYTDISILVKVEDGGDIYDLGNLHTLNEKAKVFLAEVSDPEAGYERTWYVVRYHNGEAELLKEGEDYVVENGEISLLSDKFSLFAFAFLDKLAQAEPTEAEPAEETEETETEEEPEEESSYIIRPAEAEEAEETAAPNTGAATAKEVSSTTSIFPIVALATLITIVGFAKTLKHRKVSE